MFERDPKTARMGKEIFPFETKLLPEFFQRKAAIELNDTPENRTKGLKVLKELMENDKIFDGTNFDEELLVQYLRYKKFDAKRALARLKAFVILRKNYKNLFNNYHFANLAVTTRKKICSFLPYRCQDGCAILLVKLDNWDPQEFTIENVKRMVVLSIAQALRIPMTQVNGFKVIFDVKSNPLRHIRYCSPSNMYLLYHGTQECSPGRFKAFHVVNMSLTGKVALEVLKFMLTDKLKRRIHLHEDPKKLLDYFPAAVLPEEYGGELADYDLTDWLKRVISDDHVAVLCGQNQPAS